MSLSRPCQAAMSGMTGGGPCSISSAHRVVPDVSGKCVESIHSSVSTQSRGTLVRMSTRETRGRKSRAAIYRQLAHGAEELRTCLGGLPTPVEAEDIWGDIWYQEAHNSTVHRGQYARATRSRNPPCRGTRGGGQAAGRVYGGSRVRRRRGVGLPAGLSPGDWTTGDLVTLTEVRHVHTLAMSKVWEVAPQPDADPAEGPVRG